MKSEVRDVLNGLRVENADTRTTSGLIRIQNEVLIYIGLALSDIKDELYNLSLIWYKKID